MKNVLLPVLCICACLSLASNAEALSVSVNDQKELVVSDPELGAENIDLYCEEGELIISSVPLVEMPEIIHTTLLCGEITKITLDFSNNTNDLNISLGQISLEEFPSLGSTVIRTGSGADNILGSPVSDTCYAGEGDDNFDGDGGADRFYGQGGDDNALGGTGNDILSGGSGNDLLFGEDDIDKLVGGKGADLLIGGKGLDKLIRDRSDKVVKQ